MIVSISVEPSSLSRQFQSFCSAEFNPLARSWNISNVTYIPRPEGGIISKSKINPPAWSWNFPLMNGILRLEVENFSLADIIESSVQNMILSSTVELSLLTAKYLASARDILILWLQVESFSTRMTFSIWKLRMSLSQLVMNLTAGRW